MGDIANLQQLVASLTPNLLSKDKVQILENIAHTWKPVAELPAVKEFLKGSNIITEFAAVLRENESAWVSSCPFWVGILLLDLYYYSSLQSEVNLLYQSLRPYLLRECKVVLENICNIAGRIAALVIQDDAVYKILKNLIASTDIQQAFVNFAANNNEWRLKLMQDDQFIHLLLAQEASKYVWKLLTLLAQHPDAKTLLPQAVFTKASTSSETFAFDICALLGDDKDINNMNIDAQWLTQKAYFLRTTLTGQTVEDADNIGVGLLSIILPIANLAVIEDFKVRIGQLFCGFLKQVICKTDFNLNAEAVSRAKQEAAKALWNLAYLPSNRALIANDNGLEKLNDIWCMSKDPILVKNLAGIKFMFETPAIVPETSTPVSKGYVMISYNWGSQLTVKRIAKALQEQGYSVWLDIEQMKGSTLEAMASAVEHADLVLVCVSQKYKDSPNCRLEGEYCVNRRINFIPLMMQQNYKPEGWLGIMMGTQLWYDFTNEHNWDAKMSQLINAIGDRGKGQKQLQASTVVSASTTQPASLPNFTSWTISDVQEWLKGIKLGHHSDSFAQHDIDGQALAIYKNYAKEMTFEKRKCVCKDLGMTKIGEMLRFSDALDKL